MADEPTLNDSKSIPANPIESSGTHPLPYEAPRDRLRREPQPNSLLKMMVFGGGFTLAAGVVFFVNLAVVLHQDGKASRNLLHFIAAIYGLIGVVTVVGFADSCMRTGQRTAGGWFGTGALLGIGLSLLIGGICFGSL